MTTAALQQVIFAFFVFGIVGWFLESLQESIVRHRIVNKGFFRGPFVPCQGIGGVAVYFLAAPFRGHPAAVFFVGVAVCTLVEYATALFLEKAFHVKCWDYTTYPHTRFAQFQGRVCLTISFFFGVITLAVVYFFWDAIVTVTTALGPALFWVDTALLFIFLVDAVYSITSVIKNRKNGKNLTSWALFSTQMRRGPDGMPAANPGANVQNGAPLL
jgi:uncharacterized membrane protein